MSNCPADFADAAVAALRGGAPILCDSKMVANGITRARLPAGNEVICTLDDPRVPALARDLDNTRSAAAMELWRERLAGSIVVFGNAPTALFRLLEMVREGAPRPAAVIGIPVGFVGAVESKQALAAASAIFPSWWCMAGAAARPWRQRPSMPWRARTNDSGSTQKPAISTASALGRAIRIT